MKFLLLIISILHFGFSTTEESFTGKWHYSFEDQTSFDLDLIQNGTTITGQHFSFFQGGRYIDSSFDDEITIKGEVKNGVAIVSVQSGYEARIPGKAKIEHIGKDSIFFTFIKEPSDGLFMIPDSVILVKKK